jgi:hypothetical protein
VHERVIRIGNSLSKSHIFIKYYKILFWIIIHATLQADVTRELLLFWIFRAVFIEPPSVVAKTFNPVFTSLVTAVAAVTYTTVTCTAIKATRGGECSHFIRGYGWRPDVFICTYLLRFSSSCMFSLGFSRKFAVVTIDDSFLLFSRWAKESLEDLAIGLGGEVQYPCE